MRRPPQRLFTKRGRSPAAREWRGGYIDLQRGRSEVGSISGIQATIGGECPLRLSQRTVGPRKRLLRFQRSLERGKDLGCSKFGRAESSYGQYSQLRQGIWGLRFKNVDVLEGGFWKNTFPVRLQVWSGDRCVPRSAGCVGSREQSRDLICFAGRVVSYAQR